MTFRSFVDASRKRLLAAGHRLVALDDFREYIRQRRVRFDPPSTHADRFFLKEISMSKFDVPQRLAMPSYFNSSQDLRHRDRADWQHVQPVVKEFAFSFIETMRQRQIPFYAHCAYRTRQDQNDLVSKGRSRRSYPMGEHNQGRAVDLVHGRYHWELTNVEWRVVGLVAHEVFRSMQNRHPRYKKYYLRWGGDWDRDGIPVLDDPSERFWDPAHFEIHHLNIKSDYPVLTVGDPVRISPRGYLRR